MVPETWICLRAPFFIVTTLCQKESHSIFFANRRNHFISNRVQSKSKQNLLIKRQICSKHWIANSREIKPQDRNVGTLSQFSVRGGSERTKKLKQELNYRASTRWNSHVKYATVIKIVRSGWLHFRPSTQKAMKRKVGGKVVGKIYFVLTLDCIGNSLSTALLNYKE